MKPWETQMHKKKSSFLVWKQIDLDAIAHNIGVLKGLTKKETSFMAVVKADAYGHGAVPVAQKALESGATHLGVARFHEAMELRKAGIKAPILVFGYTMENEINKLIKLDITPTVFNFETARMISAKAVKKACTIKVHLKLDTGMGRLGILPDSRRVNPERKGGALLEVLNMAALPGIKIEGIYTHFAAADSRDKTYTCYQIQAFTNFIEQLKGQGLDFSLVHSANSAALIAFPETHFNMVRAGIAMYGLAPSNEVNIESLGLRPAMEIRSIITSVKEVPKAFKVSYGMTYETADKSVIASVPIGYADGFSRLLSSRGSMLVKGKKAPVAGRVCMDQTLIDVGKIPGITLGDEVVILGSQEKETITADEIAGLINTINYEVVSSLTARIPKTYPKKLKLEHRLKHFFVILNKPSVQTWKDHIHQDLLLQSLKKSSLRVPRKSWIPWSKNLPWKSKDRTVPSIWEQIQDRACWLRVGFQGLHLPFPQEYKALYPCVLQGHCHIP